MNGSARHHVVTADAVDEAFVLLALLALPVSALVMRGGMEGLRQLGGDGELRAALGLTVLAASVATITTVALGTPLAWMLARNTLPGGALVSALVELPLLIPHPV